MPESSAKPFQPIPFAAGVVVMIVSPLVSVGCYQWFGNYAVASVIIGLLVGLAIKFTSKRPDRRLAIAAIVMSVIASFIGYIWTEHNFVSWVSGTPPTIAESAVRFFRDLFTLICTALGAWISYSLAKAPAGVPPAPE